MRTRPGVTLVAVDTVAVAKAAQNDDISRMCVGVDIHTHSRVDSDVRWALRGDVGVCQDVGTQVGHQTAWRAAILWASQSPETSRWCVISVSAQIQAPFRAVHLAFEPFQRAKGAACDAPVHARTATGSLRCGQKQKRASRTGGSMGAHLTGNRASPRPRVPPFPHAPEPPPSATMCRQGTEGTASVSTETLEGGGDNTPRAKETFRCWEPQRVVSSSARAWFCQHLSSQQDSCR